MNNAKDKETAINSINVLKRILKKKFNDLSSFQQAGGKSKLNILHTHKKDKYNYFKCLKVKCHKVNTAITARENKHIMERINKDGSLKQQINVV